MTFFSMLDKVLKREQKENGGKTGQLNLLLHHNLEFSISFKGEMMECNQGCTVEGQEYQNMQDPNRL